MVDKSYEIVRFLKQKDYEMIDESLGKGSFGKAVLLRDPFIDELFVAKKYEPSDESIRDQYYENFLKEIKILYKLTHPNIVRIYNYYAYERQRTGYILMEFIKGTNIVDYLENISGENKKYSKWDDIFNQIIEAFCCIESNKIVHRDIRENNILITDDGIVKIIDFGIGKTFDEDVAGKKTSYDSLAREINRPNTLPQEYYEQKYTIKTDMFYIGELFNRLLGQLVGEKGSKIFSYQEIVRKMMKIDPNERFGSFLEIKELLSQDALSQISVTDSDKETYKGFVDEFCSCISSFSNSPIYNTESSFISNLEKTLQDNIFEDYVQDNAALVSCLVRSKYSFYRDEEIVAVENLSNFVRWYKKHNKNAREIIFSNIINKLNKIKVIVDYDVPF